MSKRPILTALLLASLAASSAPAQLLGGRGGGPLGGLGNVTGAVGGRVGGTVSNVGGAVGGPVGGSLGQAGGRLSGTLSNVGGGLNGTLNQVGGGLSNTSSGIANVSGFGGSRLAQLISSDTLQDLTPVDGYLTLGPDEMADLRQLRHQALIQANRRTLDRDEKGEPVRKGELIACDPDPASLAAAQRAGFRITGYEPVNLLGVRIVKLAPPPGMNVRQGLAALHRAAPNLQADYNHIYEPAGGALLPATGASLAVTAAVRPGTRIAMIDGGVAAHPSLAAAGIEQRGFVGDPQPTGHGTAIGSLLVGSQGRFHGAARGAQLFVGDVYGGDPAAGSATAIVQALAWAASKRPSVINISLIGPPNRTMERAIAAVRAKGISVVAAVGNDGPAAPPQYPASYPGVIAVTGVDAADRALREAGRSAHLDFAAPGADLVAALPGRGYTPVRGTSFAAPFVAARLAATGSMVQLAAEATPGKGKVGRGVVCGTCRILPKMVGFNIK
ncbi:MAG TPA: S8 family serine peptidase [Sphingomicrobium sp.]|jgi:hypothetical protein|nr:S8 family serine peptidase [Sphingomicrobium sp.]